MTQVSVPQSRRCPHACASCPHPVAPQLASPAIMLSMVTCSLGIACDMQAVRPTQWAQSLYSLSQSDGNMQPPQAGLMAARKHATVQSSKSALPHMKIQACIVSVRYHRAGNKKHASGCTSSKHRICALAKIAVGRHLAVGAFGAVSVCPLLLCEG